MQHGLLTVDHQRVAGVMAALITHHRRDLIGQQVNDLALTLIAPLGPQDDNILTHVQPMPH